MKNTTMTKGTVPMSTPQIRTRIERSQSAHLLAPVTGQAWGMTPCDGAHAQPMALTQGGNVAGRALGCAPSAQDRLATAPAITTLTTPFMDVADFRFGRPPV